MNPGRPRLAAWLLEKLAERPDLTQAQLAQAIGVSQQRISEWLSGRKRPRERNCIRLARFFGGDPSAVLDLAGHQPLGVPEPGGAPTLIRESPRPYRAPAQPVAPSPVRPTGGVPIHPWAEGRAQAAPEGVLRYWQPPGVLSPTVYAFPPGACSFGPQITESDTVFTDVQQAPRPGELVVVFFRGSCRVYRWKGGDAGSALEDAEGSRHPMEDRHVAGVVVVVFKPAHAFQ